MLEARMVEGTEASGAISQVMSAMTEIRKSGLRISSRVKKAGARLSQ